MFVLVAAIWNASAHRACTEHFTHPQRESQCGVELVSSCQLSRVAELRCCSRSGLTVFDSPPARPWCFCPVRAYCGPMWPTEGWGVVCDSPPWSATAAAGLGWWIVCAVN